MSVARKDLRALKRMEAVMKMYDYLSKCFSRTCGLADKMIPWESAWFEHNSHTVFTAIKDFQEHVCSHENLRKKIEAFFDCEDEFAFTSKKINPTRNSGEGPVFKLFERFKEMMENDKNEVASDETLSVSEFLHVTRGLPLFYPALSMGMTLPVLMENDLSYTFT